MPSRLPQEGSGVGLRGGNAKLGGPASTSFQGLETRVLQVPAATTESQAYAGQLLSLCHVHHCHHVLQLLTPYAHRAGLVYIFWPQVAVCTRLE